MAKLALALVLVAGCSGKEGSTDIEPTLRFADRTDTEIGWLIDRGAGTDVFSAQAQVDQLADILDNDPCPTVMFDGDAFTVTGGCRRSDGNGTEVRGSAIVTNPRWYWRLHEYDPTAPSRYEFRQLALVVDAGADSFDGFVERADSTTVPMTVIDADITVARFGIAVRSDLYYVCSNPSAPRCALSGSGLELVGAGGAHVSGTVTFDSDMHRQTASFTMTGADTLTFHDDGACVAWSISGTDRGTACP